ncbi:putative membrane protein (plasmid) [Bacillus methanolicus MGA3]|uniref:Putative membrane protein n=1 Tax=Bacillus methanolicus (strain MGA3 / ATCC 53907) TaxID=796606 RepID=A0A068M1Z6_BACMM|nr:putative membrane protein [Bacillus methanolicus MGA3]
MSRVHISLSSRQLKKSILLSCGLFLIFKRGKVVDEWDQSKELPEVSLTSYLQLSCLNILMKITAKYHLLWVVFFIQHNINYVVFYRWEWYSLDHKFNIVY